MKRRRRLNGFYMTSMGVFLLFVAAFMAAPLVSLIRTSLTAPTTGGFSLENYVSVFTSKLYQISFKNSALLSFLSSLYGILIALCCSYALTRFASEKTQSNLLLVVNVTSNFAGIPLAFALTLMLGNTGMFIILLERLGIDLGRSFDVYSSQGLTIAYTYFQVPLGILLLYPIYRGIREDWKEAAFVLGASSAQFWRRIGIPAILPSILSTFTVLFANAMGAYATAYYLVSSDRVFVMHQGVIAQEGAPGEIYTSPASEFVARFIGHYNVLSPEDAGLLLGINIPNCKAVAIRPEVISLFGGENLYAFGGKVVQTSMLGSIIRYQLDCKGIPIHMEAVNHNAQQLAVGESAILYVNEKDLVFIKG